MVDKAKTSIGKDAVKLTTSKVITMVITLLSAMLLSRFRSLEEYGTYSQLLLVVNLTTALFMIGLPNSVNYFLAHADSEEKKQNYLSVFYTLSTTLSIAVGLVLVCTAPLITRFFNNDMTRNFIYFLAIYPWVTIIASSIDNILIVYQKLSMLMLYRILNSGFVLLLIIVAQIFELSFTFYMQLFLAIQAIFALSVYVIVRDISKKLHILIDFDLIKKILNFSIPIGLASVVGILNIQFDKLVIGNLLGISELAIYTNASTEVPVTIISSSLTAVLMPSLVRLLRQNKRKEAIELWGNATKLSYILICFVSTSLFVFSPDVMTLLYSDKYLSGVPVFRVFCIILLLRCTYFGIILNSRGKTKLIFYSALASLLLNIVLCYLFYEIFGFIGPALATLVSSFIIAGFQLIATAYTIEESFKNIFPWKELFHITLINVFLGILFLFIKDFLQLENYAGEILESVILGIVWGFVYICIFFKTFRREWDMLNRGKDK